MAMYLHFGTLNLWDWMGFTEMQGKEKEGKHGDKVHNK